MRDIDLNAIHGALKLLERQSQRLFDNAVRSDAYDRAREVQETANKGLAAYNHLSEVWPRARALIADAERAYDRRVLAGRELPVKF